MVEAVFAFGLVDVLVVLAVVLVLFDVALVLLAVVLVDLAVVLAVDFEGGVVVGGALAAVEADAVAGSFQTYGVGVPLGIAGPTTSIGPDGPQADNARPPVRTTAEQPIANKIPYLFMCQLWHAGRSRRGRWAEVS